MSASTPVTPETSGGPMPETVGAPQPMQSSAVNHRKPPRSHGLLGLLAWVIGILFALPVAWMILTSLHSETDAATNPPSIFAPLSLEGYKAFFDAGPWPALLNSLTASVVSTILVLLLAFPAAYALSIRPVKAAMDGSAPSILPSERTVSIRSRLLA